MLVVARHGLDRTFGDYQVEPGGVPGAPTRACAMELDHWGDGFGTVSVGPGKLSFLSFGCGMLRG